MFHGLYIIEHSSNSCNGNVNTMDILETWTQTCDRSQTPPPRMNNRPSDKKVYIITNYALNTTTKIKFLGFGVVVRRAEAGGRQMLKTVRHCRGTLQKGSPPIVTWRKAAERQVGPCAGLGSIKGNGYSVTVLRRTALMISFLLFILDDVLEDALLHAGSLPKLVSERAGQVFPGHRDKS